MQSPLTQDIKSAASHFQFRGEFVSGEAFGTGHINDTYRVTCSHSGERVLYTLQRINHAIFKDPVAMMDNIQRVTTHLRAKLIAAGVADVERRALSVVPSREGKPYHRDERGNYWRAYIFVDYVSTYDAVQSPQQAFEGAKTFGRFQAMLADLPSPRLHDTIPNFHNTPKRFAALEQAIAADTCNRARLAKPEIEFALRRKPMTSVLTDLLQRGEISERITHNDTKFNNVLLDDATGEAICVIDLDTVMPGIAIFDFGELIRTATSPAAEDERDLSKVQLRLPFFEALARGYLSTMGPLLNPAERDHLAFAGKLMTFENGLRFLTDYLNGDTYYKIHRDGHNLDRCRTQFHLTELIEHHEEQMQRIVEREA